MGIHDLWLFVVAGLLLNLTPGPDMALIIARSARSGTRAGSAAALGIGAGCFVHIAAAAAGVSALVMASATAFTLLKWAGAAYLLYIGFKMLCGASRPAATGSDPRGGTEGELRSAFLQGFLTNALNPKVSMFYLAAFPQFIPAGEGAIASAFTLVAIHSMLNIVWFTSMILLIARLKSSVAASAAFQRWLKGVTGAVFIAFGVKLATFRP
jgi:threonine/homoserine/homoserine lactone efflux protein